MFFLDDSGLTDLRHVVHAARLDPPEDFPPDDRVWQIFLILHVGHQSYTVTHEYLTRDQREAAFERLLAQMQHLLRVFHGDEEEED